MIDRVVVVFMSLLFVSPAEVAAATWQERPDWAQFFQRAGVGGTIVIVDQRAGADTHLVHGTERAYLRKISYGNADPSGGVDTFWLSGNLRISADEQVAFLQKLYRNALPFRVEHQRLVKDVMIVEAGRNWVLRAKTGWAARAKPQVGWWVGWVEQPDGPVFFAINIDMPNGADDLPKREGAAREVLKSIGALPED
jgi:beta-lactamase class D